MAPNRKQPTVLMIWTRPIDGQRMAGRLRVAIAVREAFRGAAAVREHVMEPAITEKRLLPMLAALWAWSRSWLLGPLLPLQCAIYSGRDEIERAVTAVVPEIDTIYLDGVRTFALLRELRKKFPDRRIIVDMDDLMSRRLKLLRQDGHPLSSGHLMMRLPPVLRALSMGAMSRLIVRYEAWTLPAVEAAITHLADVVVLLSSEDMRALDGTGPARRETIMPGIGQITKRPALRPGAVRFIFIGTDALTQNRLSIDYLLTLWRIQAIEHELVIFGAQTRALTLPRGVSTRGYVKDLSDIYNGSSVLVSPSFLRGGIKTKVLEAFAHGAPVIGNAATFEAMPLDEYPMRLDTEHQLLAVLRNPEAHRAALEQSARIGAAYLADVHAPGKFTRAWVQTLEMRANAEPLGARSENWVCTSEARG